MIHFSLIQKFVRVPLKNRFRLSIIVPGKSKYFLKLLHCIKTCTLAIISSALPNIFFMDFPMVIYDSNKCEIVCAIAIIFQSFAVTARKNNNHEVTRKNHQKWHWKGSQRQSKYIRPKQKNLYALHTFFCSLAETIFQRHPSQFLQK